MFKQLSFFEFLMEVFWDLLRFKQNKALSIDVLIKQILFTGYEALGILATISLLIGAIVIDQGYSYLGALGQTEWIYKILISTVLRDVGPFITAFVILARSGTAISTELGNMSVNKEVDALKSLGISPVSYLVSPRVLGMVVSMVILIIYFAIIGIFGGYMVSNFFSPLPFAEFLSRLTKIMGVSDLIVMISKTALSGFFISTICSFQGLSVQRAFTEVPQRNIKAVVNSVIAILLVNLIVSMLQMLWLSL